MIIPSAVEDDGCQDKIEQIQKDNPACKGALELVDRTGCAQMLWAAVDVPPNPICVEQIKTACEEYCLTGLDNEIFALACVADACVYYIDKLTNPDI